MRIMKSRGKLLVLAMLGASLGASLLDGGMALAAGAPGGTPFSVGVYPDPVVLLQSSSPSPPTPPSPSPSVLPCQVSTDPAQGQAFSTGAGAGTGGSGQGGVTSFVATGSFCLNANGNFAITNISNS